MNIIFAGDPHGNYTAARRAANESSVSDIVFLGDMDLDRPFAEEVADFPCESWFVAGNHDYDRQEWFERLYQDGGAGDLNGRVIEIAGLRVAGLGGVFQEGVWHPKSGDGRPLYDSPEAWMAEHVHVRGGHLHPWQAPWETEPGLPLKLRGAIWPSAFDAMADMQADVLVTHEAPTSHKYGFPEIDLLAEAMGCQLVVHGHVHADYEAVLPSGIRVVGVGKAKVCIPAPPSPNFLLR